ncbi:MAG: sigma-70 family RNA polymerase sigma factor, partial [Planctomycetes bacterium]|nr:sigma-70 family RNA polymerase sigma factor [Planctomycetota bacterium]
MRDDELVDDVVQDTYVAAIESPPRDIDRAPAWLGTVTRNFVRLHLRSRVRRERRERRSARPEAAPVSPSGVEEDEVRSLVTQQVLDLDEPYRSTVIELFYRETSVKALARRLGLPESTIRVRKKRALDQLRAALDAREPEGRRAWIAGLVGVYGWPAAGGGSGGLATDGASATRARLRGEDAPRTDGA